MQQLMVQAGGSSNPFDLDKWDWWKPEWSKVKGISSYEAKFSDGTYSWENWSNIYDAIMIFEVSSSPSSSGLRTVSGNLVHDGGVSRFRNGQPNGTFFLGHRKEYTPT